MIPIRRPHGLVPALLLALAAGCQHAPTPKPAASTPASAPATSPTPAGSTAPTEPIAPKPDASVARSKPNDERFMRMHHEFLARARSGPVDLLFLGDSITQGWSGRGRTVWEEYYAPLHAANFGIGGDQTMGVIWRIENGELDGIDPRVVILLLGSNNSALHTGKEIAAANAKIVRLIRERMPKTKVLVLAIFPRGPRIDSQGKVDDHLGRMAVIADANARLAGLDDGQHVRFFDLNYIFLDASGNIPSTLMPDQLHPDTGAYRLWAEAMQPILAEMMNAPR